MPNDTKWRSPHGHPIASDVTDKMPRSEQTDLLAEAVKVIEFYGDEKNHECKVESAGCGCCSDILPSDVDVDSGQRARDFLAKIER